ncbi:MAG: hypothetical protein QXT63_05750, partial [Thermoplasmata archaeon]
PIIKEIEPSPPSNELKYSETVGLAFTVHCQDPDGDELTITWKEEGVTLGQRSVLIQKFAVGHHTITAYVSDGKDSAEQSISFEITKAESGTTDTKMATYLLALVTIVIVVAIIAIIIKGMRRKKPVTPIAPQGMQAQQPSQQVTAPMQNMQYATTQTKPIESESIPSELKCIRCGLGISPQEVYTCMCGNVYHARCITDITQCQACGALLNKEVPEIVLPKSEKPISLRKKRD